MKSNLAIISGVKSITAEVAKLLAVQLDMHVLDFDDLIEYDMEININQIIQEHGIDGFYKFEKSRIRRVREYENAIIAPSPTFLVDIDNITQLKDTAYIIVLNSDPSKEHKRFKKDNTLVMKEYLSECYGTVLKNKQTLIDDDIADIVVDIDNMRAKQIVVDIISKLDKVFC